MAQKSVNSDKMLNLGYRVYITCLFSFVADAIHLMWYCCLQVLMKRNSTYIAFVLAGALLGERVSPNSQLQAAILPFIHCVFDFRL